MWPDRPPPEGEDERALLAALRARGWEEDAVLNADGDALFRRVWFGVPVEAPESEQMGWVRVEHSTATAGVVVRWVSRDNGPLARGTLASFDLRADGLGVVRTFHAPTPPGEVGRADKERRKADARARVEARRRAHPLNEWWRR